MQDVQLTASYLKPSVTLLPHDSLHASKNEVENLRMIISYVKIIH